MVCSGRRDWTYGFACWGHKERPTFFPVQQPPVRQRRPRALERVPQRGGKRFSSELSFENQCPHSSGPMVELVHQRLCRALGFRKNHPNAHASTGDTVFNLNSGPVLIGDLLNNSQTQSGA